jgi:hypothetical protein
LVSHAAGCEVCEALIAVARAFAESEETAIVPPLPDASVVWLRSQVRARAEAARLAERPISVAQAVAFASVVGVLCAVLGATSTWLQQAIRATAAAVVMLRPQALEMSTTVTQLLVQHAGIAAMIGLAAVLMPVAVYWGLREN